MNSVVEIIVVMIGIIILGGIGYLAFDIYNTHKPDSQDQSFTGVLKHTFNTIKKDIKTGYHMTGVDIRTGGEVLEESAREAGDTIETDIKTGAEVVVDDVKTGAEVVADDIRSGARHLTGHHGSTSEEGATSETPEGESKGIAIVQDIKTGAKVFAEDVALGATMFEEDVKTGAQHVVGATTKPVEDIIDKTSKGKERDIPKQERERARRARDPSIHERHRDDSDGESEPDSGTGSHPRSRSDPQRHRGVLSTIGHDIKLGAKEFVYDVLEGTERVVDATTGEISDDTHLVTKGITKLNQKIDQGIESLKDDIFHIHDRVSRVERHGKRGAKPSRYYKYDDQSDDSDDPDDYDRDQGDDSYDSYPEGGRDHASGSHSHRRRGRRGRDKCGRSSDKHRDSSHPHSDDPPRDHTHSSGKKEVFNISQNEFTYSDAPLVCKAYGAELASYDQVLDAYHRGANWCNYGWSQNQMALYPIQEKFYEDVQAGPVEHKDDCGKPGINGGYFEDASLKFGVNCYGVRPKADPKKIVYIDADSEDYVKQLPFEQTQYTHHDALHHKLASIKDRLKRDNVNPTPFSQHRWSQNSKEDSRYIMEKNYGTATVSQNLQPLPSTSGSDGNHETTGDCQTSSFGCCRDGFTAKRDPHGKNCPGWVKKCQSGPSDPQGGQFVISEETIL